MAIKRGKFATQCIHGHEFTEANTIITANGTRACRQCNRILQRSRKRKVRALAKLTKQFAQFRAERAAAASRVAE